MSKRSRAVLSLVTLTVVASCHHHRSATSELSSGCSPLSSALDPAADVSVLTGSYQSSFTATVGPRLGQSVKGQLTLRAQASSLVALPARADQMVTTQPVIGQLDVNVEEVGGLRMGDPMSADPAAPGVGLYVTRSPGGVLSGIVGRVGSGSNARDIERYDGGYFTIYPRLVTATELRGDWRSGGGGGEPPVEARGYFCAVRTGA